MNKRANSIITVAIIVLALSIWQFNSIQTQIVNLQDQNGELQTQNADLKNQTIWLQNQNSKLQDKVTQLQEQPGVNYSSPVKITAFEYDMMASIQWCALLLTTQLKLQ